MTDDWLLRAEAICLQCDGHCCNDAHPPISAYCHKRLLAEGVPEDAFEQNGYRYVRSRSDGTCIMSRGGKCSIHGIKPDTCRAGPFTFDVCGDTIEIFLKYESICPLVGLLREVPEAYEQQYTYAVRNITRLVANLDDDELAAVCRIEEPETEKVAEIPRAYRNLP